MNAAINVKSQFVYVANTNNDDVQNNRKVKYRKLYKSNGVRVSRAAQPLTIEQARIVKDYFFGKTHKYSCRNYMMFVVGINIGRRIGDMLKLKVGDVYNIKTQSVLDSVWVREQKTGNQIEIYFNNNVKDAIKFYIDHINIIDGNDYLFYSPKENKYGEHKVSYVQTWRVINKAKLDLNLNVSGGTHILRKTFGSNVYHSNPSNEALQTLQDMFGHKSQKDTLRYIGSMDETRKDIMLNLKW